MTALAIPAFQVASGSQAAEQTVLKDIPDDREVIVYCRSGARSNKVIETLIQLGYDKRKLVNVEGGILAWARQIDQTMPVY